MNCLVRWNWKHRGDWLLLSRSLRIRLKPGNQRKGYFLSSITDKGRAISHTTREKAATGDDSNSTIIIQTPVAIVGGGPSGLLLSNLLSIYKVPSVLLDGQSLEQRCSHPQAHFLNTRTMEILRHQVPRVYERLVHHEMTPVHQWKHFQFGYNMLPTTQMARVDHPVDRPLVANRDANGTLVGASDEMGSSPTNGSVHQGRPLSICSVGHLAQHTFCRILHDAAVEEALEDTELYYSTRVTSIEESKSNSNIESGFMIHTDADKTIHSKICIAADGAHSYCRGQWGITQVGNVGIQHLLNIHVKTCPNWARSFLHANDTNFAMLYSVFHPNIVAMIVCHSVGEYVFQVPFFPPYQSLEDYSEQQVLQMVYDATGIDNNSTAANANVEIVSIKAWTMSSLIAEKYSHTVGGSGGAGYLVGDAAHVFPPAGGLGMNTGMQDVYALAWKLAWAYHNKKLSLTDADAVFKASTDANSELLDKIGHSYEKERRPVAQANAALSVRNYNRLLEITKACYLSEQHPTLLIKALEASSSLLPFAARRDIFQRLFATATLTLSSLRDGQHPYTKHLRRNIRRILANGGGLPLLFPTAELGFQYNANDATIRNTNIRSEEDTMGFPPAIQTGRLFPHVVLTLRNSINVAGSQFPNLRILQDASEVPASTRRPAQQTISSSDLPAQMARDTKPCFVLLFLSNNPTANPVTSLIRGEVEYVAAQLGMAVEIVHIISSQNINYDSATLDNDGYMDDEEDHLTLWEVPHYTEGLLFEQYSETTWLIRPDGHVAGEICSATESSKDTLPNLRDELMHYAKGALFGSKNR